MTKKTIVKRPIKQKRPAQASPCKTDQIRDSSRNDLIKALSEIGIVAPSSVKTDKTFTLFSAPVAEESASYHVRGVEGRRESDLELVPKALRKAIVEGCNVNLVHLLIPQDNDEYHDNIIHLHSKADPRFDRHLTIVEFILAFSRYMNIMCEVFSHRRGELMAYMSDIIRLSARFGHSFFYDYHCLFARKAEALLRTRNVLTDWSKRDHDTYFLVFSGLRPIVCNYCRSPDHFTHFCNKVLDESYVWECMFANTSVRAGNPSDASSLLLRSSVGEMDEQEARSTCKFFNGAGFGRCVRLNCRFDHLCSRCRGNHPKNACTQKTIN